MRHIPTLQVLSLMAILLMAGCSKEEVEEQTISETSTCLTEINGEFIEIELQRNPLYLRNGGEGLYENVITHVSYPAEARENNIQGECEVNYEITRAGTVENIIIVLDPGGGIGLALVQALEMATEGVSFDPGVHAGAPVRVRKGLRAIFKLQ